MNGKPVHAQSLLFQPRWRRWWSNGRANERMHGTEREANSLKKMTMMMMANKQQQLKVENIIYVPLAHTWFMKIDWFRICPQYLRKSIFISFISNFHVHSRIAWLNWTCTIRFLFFFQLILFASRSLHSVSLHVYILIYYPSKSKFSVYFEQGNEWFFVRRRCRFVWNLKMNWMGVKESEIEEKMKK